MSFSNKVVLVTGASSGIGSAIAKVFAKEGAYIVMTGRNKKKLDSVAEQCARTGNIPHVIIADLTYDDNIKRIIQNTIEKFGQLDILINNAGIVGFGNILDGTVLNSYDNIMNTNLRAVVSITTLAAPYLIKTKGTIVNISSVAATTTAIPNYLAYAISKAGINSFTRGAALELAKWGVRVNAISPGPVNTDFAENAGIEVAWDSLRKALPLGRVSEAGEIADLVLFLASDKVNGITGSIYSADNVLKRVTVEFLPVFFSTETTLRTGSRLKI